MKSAAVVSKPDKEELYKIAPPLLEWLKAHGYQILVDNETSAYTQGYEVVHRERIAEKAPTMVVVLGGDGTLLSAARAVAKADIPILGVNLGSLGFLTEVPLEELYPTLEALDRDECEAEARSMLYCELVRRGQVIADYHALNDAVINKSAISRLLNVDLYIDQRFVSNYKADGLIISTPTGSTAYSMSAGGPILMPSVSAHVISPVCPHSLTHRPLVVRDTVQIEVVACAVEQEAFLSIDGQVGVPVVDGDRLICRKSQHTIKLLRMKKAFFDVLRTKLKWGQG